MFWCENGLSLIQVLYLKNDHPVSFTLCKPHDQKYSLNSLITLVKKKLSLSGLQEAKRWVIKND